MTESEDEKAMADLKDLMTRLIGLLEQMFDTQQGSILGQRIEEMTFELKQINASLASLAPALTGLDAMNDRFDRLEQMVLTALKEQRQLRQWLGAPPAGPGETG